MFLYCSTHKLYKLSCIDNLILEEIIFQMNDHMRLLQGPFETKEIRIVTAQLWKHSKTINILEVKKENNTSRSGKYD